MRRLRNTEGISREIVHRIARSLFRDAVALGNTWDVVYNYETREKLLERVTQGLAAALPILLELEIEDDYVELKHDGMPGAAEADRPMAGLERVVDERADTKLEAPARDVLDGSIAGAIRNRLRAAVYELNSAIECGHEMGLYPTFEADASANDDTEWNRVVIESWHVPNAF